MVDSEFWTPTWPGSGARTDLNDYSDTYSFIGTKSFIRDGGYSFSKTGRSSITVSQAPNAGNGNTLILSANDIGVPGAAWHTIHVLPAGESPMSENDNDSDNDGYMDGAEHKYRGNPFKAAGVPTFMIWSELSDGLTLRLPTQVGKSYDLESIDNLDGLGPWNKVQQGIAGDGEVFEVTLPTSAGQRFFQFLELSE